MPKQEFIGYRTWATEQREAFEGIMAMLGARKTNWRQLADSLVTQLETLNEQFKSVYDGDLDDESKLARLTPINQRTMSLMNGLYVCTLGLDVMAVHDRLAKVENEAAGLRKALRR